MSHNNQTSEHIPEAGAKLIDDDKSALYESSSRTDSGFISSGNLIVSGEIDEFQEEFKEKSSGNIQEDQQEQDQSSAKLFEESTHMRIDSGIGISENFSNLSLRSRGYNDLSSSNGSKKMIESNVDNFDDIPWKVYYDQDEDGDTHLHAAIIEGFLEVALALIRAAPHPRLLDTPNDDCQTPLHLAVESRQPRIVRWLLVAGARPCPRDIRGDSPLHIAARLGDLQCIKALADPVLKQERDALHLSYSQEKYQPCSLDQWNYVGQTCVHVAAQKGHIDILRHLVWYGADINAREGCMGYTALHYAFEAENEKLVQFLLTVCGLNPETETYGGKNALEIRRNVSSALIESLKARGVPSPYSSDDEEMDSDDDIENVFDNSVFNVGNSLVQASA